ncbi:MAG: DNA repair protein RecO [Candidatus Omnitrophota bacterium]|nr:DNA repair protein RecO [Candidatus Omnitrophota bacterium]MBU1929084.1 DNA repair protein RecO [Candidatus Omnitrophota bacterium]MBU1929165.1 DNA repair protein RecO [Candidatus Omnitrophota bacterium]MBU2035045.1 DNA repair protein RecO [Candidatus Omnitrophota bacterium]MBU2222119.1 DNA repair protein RecO [Candidatus Omnitrophota bacterium]
MPIHKAEAIVLSKRDFRETSLIVNFYTREFGKLSGILKGIRKEPIKFASSLEPFSLNDIVFYKNRSTTLHLVSQCDLKDNFSSIRQNMFKVGMASIVLELIDAVMQLDDKNEDIFQLGLDTLAGLASAPNPDKITTIFKIKMLSLSGFKPNLDSCVVCSNKILGESKFSLKSGGLLCLRCAPKDLNSRSIFRGTIATILHIERNDFKCNLNLGINPQIKKELDLVLNAFLNFHLEKELKSQKVLHKIENFIPVIR